MINKKLDYDSLPIIDTPESKSQTFKISPERYQALKRSIEFDGLKESIEMMVLYSNGSIVDPKTKQVLPEGTPYLTIVDGHTRRDILVELDIPLGYSKTLPMKNKYENFIVLEDLHCIEDAIDLAHILNDIRRQSDKYQLVANALKRKKISILTDREISSKIGVAHSTITQVRNIQEKYVGFQKPNEKALAEQLMLKLESGEKSIKDVYALFNVAGEVTELITKIEDPEFQREMLSKYEAEKFTNKNALKQLQEDINSYDLKKEDKYEPTRYDKKLYPIMSNIIKLENDFTDIKTVSCEGSQSSVDNALDSIQRFLKNNMDENITDVLEAVRKIILEEYENVVEDHGNVPKDLPAIMKKIEKIYKSGKIRYFATVMRIPNNPKGNVEG